MSIIASAAYFWHNVAMKMRPGWIWRCYFLFYLFFAGLNLLYFFVPESSMFRYYHIALAFDVYFWGIYFLHLTALVFNTLTIVPLYFYTQRIQFLNRSEERRV